MSTNVREKIKQLAAERILIMDGAMGSMLSEYKSELKGCNDLFCVTKPELISGIHEAYLKAGADIIETCSFNANAISLGDYGMADMAYKINAAAAQLARKAADAFSSPDKPRFVAGSIGPTSKSASISPDINDPGKRAVTWDELESAYYDNARGLLDGGADMIVIETVFDALNAKAGISAVRRLAGELGIDLPVIVSATVMSNGGRLITGQSIEAFCVSVFHADPLALGLNCSFGAEKLKASVAAVSAMAPCLVSAYPNAGLPNHLGAYDESPDSMADQIEGYLREGLVNVVGGCCGSTPAHIAAIAERAKKYPPRSAPVSRKGTLLAGLEIMDFDKKRFLAEREGREKTAGEIQALILQGEYEDAVDIARDMVEGGASIMEVRIDGANPKAKSAITGFLNFALQYPDLSRLPFMIESSSLEIIEAGLKCLPGKSLVNYTGSKECDAEFLRASYGAEVL